MRRARAASLITAAALALWSSPAAAGIDGCGPRDIRRAVAAVPSVATTLVSAGPEATARDATYANPDDARIAMTARFVPQDAGAPMTRQAYVADIQRHLDAIPSRPGMATVAAVDPSEPVSWVVSRQVGGDTPASTGEDVIRLSATCRFVVDWQVPDVPVLQGRIAAFRRDLDALHASMVGQAEGVAYLDEDYTPAGILSLFLGLALPLGVAATLAFFALKVSEGRLPGGRVVPGVTCAVAAGGLALAVPAALGDMGTGGRYLDCAILLAVVAAVSALAATRPAPLATAAALSISAAAGMSLGAATWFGWVPGKEGMAVVAAAFVVGGALQAWSWLRPGRDGTVAARQPVDAPAEGRRARARAGA